MKKNNLKKMLSLLMIAAIGVSFAACKKTESLEGVWLQKHDESETLYQKAYIQNDGIDIYWVNDETNSTTLYWSGSFDATAKKTYVAKANTEKNSQSLLTSLDDEKTFSIGKKSISYDMLVDGQTRIVEFIKIGEKEDIVTEPSQEISETMDLEETTTSVATEETTTNQEIKEETTTQKQSSNSSNKTNDPKNNSSNNSSHKKPSGGSSSGGGSNNSSSNNKPSPKPTKPQTTKPVKHVNPKDVQNEVNKYIRSLGVKVDTSLRPDCAGWDGEFSGWQKYLDDGSTLRMLKEEVRGLIDEEGKEYIDLYCYYENETFYILYMLHIH